MKKNRLVSIIEKLATRTHSQRQTPRARSARVEQLEARELLSVARGYDFLALDDANVAGFIGGGFTVDEANAAYQASVASRVDDVVDITETMLEDVEAAVSGPGKPSEYYDADKSKKNTEDDLLCWAATASNMLWYTGWASVKGSANEQEFFDSVFVGTWPDSGDQTLTGCSWYLNAEYLSIYQSGTVRNDTSATDIDGGGAYASAFATYGESAQDYLSARPVRGVGDLTEIASNLRAGYGVGLGVDCDGSSGHAVTCWGYAVNSNLSSTDPGYYTGLYITDSDDEKSGKNDDLLNDRKLIYLDLTWDSSVQTFYGTGSYRVTDRTSYYPSGADSYYIDDATFLAPRPAKYASTDPATERETPSTVVTTANDVVNAYDGLISLREAISYASEGDAITFKNTLKGKTISLDSARGQLYIAKSLTIDASNLYDATTDAPGLTISGDDATRIMWVAADNTLALKGLEFTHGKSPACGGAIWNYGDLTVENCLFKDNNATYVNDEGGTGNYYGGAIAVKSGGKITASSTTFTGNVGGGVVSFQTDLASTFTDCVFQDNKSYSLYAVTSGAMVTATNCEISGNNSYGLYAMSGAITATDCVIKENASAGIYSYQGAVTATGCNISDNKHGIYIYQGAVTATDCVVEENLNQGVYNYKGELTATNLVVRNNQSQGIYCGANGSVNATNCLIVGNTASYGAGLELYGTANLYNCTITGNAASRAGGGVDLDESAVLNAYNTIIADNTASSGADLYIYSANAAASGYNTLSSFTGWTSGSNNLTYVASNPLFTDAANGDYSLAENSQAIDKGANSHVAVAEDLDGNARIVNGIVDLGAYERQLDFNPVVLDVPSNLRETAKTESSITVAWNAVENASGYTLGYKKSTDSVYTTIKLNGASSTSYTLTSLDNSATYNWRVRAEGNGTEYVTSAYSAARSAKPRQKLDAPNATRAATSATSATSITVSWNAVANASGYKLLYKKSTDTAYSTISFGASVTKYQLTGLVAGASYDLKMMTVGDGFNYSNSAYSVPRANPQVLATPDPSYSVVGSAAIKATWNAVPNASAYRVMYKQSGASSYITIDVSADKTDYVINDLARGTTYVLKMAAIGDGVNYISSAYSPLSTVSIPAPQEPETPSTVVTTANDVVDEYDGLISLREAISYADADADVITFARALNNATITLGGEELTVSQVTIDGSALDSITIDAAGLSRVFYCGENALLKGLTITGGNATGNQGGGVFGGTLQNCVVIGNTATSGGGIAYCDAYDCVITENTADAYGGGANYGSVTDCTISDNSVRWSGGGVSYSDATRCAITGNTVRESMGAGSHYGTLVDCVLSGNNGVYGGGAYGGTLTNCTITGNAASQSGGGVSYAKAINCLIVGNSAGQDGGGAHATGSGKLTLTNCTVADNTAENGADVYSGSTFVAYNSVILGDVYRGNYQGRNGSLVAYNTLSNYADWDDGSDNLTYVASKPLFVNAASGNYALAKNSQAIDKGDASYVTTTVDLAGNARAVNGRVDLGAYEYQGPFVVETLNAPANPRETAKTETTISVEWDPVENVTQYGLIYKKTTDSAYTTIKLDPETTSYKLTGLDGSATYYWRVRAIGDGESYLTSPYTATRSVTPRQKLATPTNVAYQATANSITATWNLVPNASSYRIMYKQAGGSYVTVDVDDPTTTSYKISGLTKDASYAIKIAAIGDGFDYSSSAYTTLTTVTTEGGSETLNAPANPRETAKTETTISVEWDPVENVTQYGLIYKKTTDSAYTTIKLDPETTSYKLAGLDGSATYYWRVRAIGDGDSYLTSAYTATRSVTPRQKLATPTNVAYQATANSITATWNLVPNASSYRIMYKQAGGSYVTVDVDDPTTTSYKISGLTKDASYAIKIAAIGDGFDYSSSAYTALTTVTTEGVPTPLATPANPRETAKTETSITVEWDPVENVKQYGLIYKKTTDSAYTTIKLDPETTSYKLAGLDGSATYYWRVRAIGDGDSYLTSAYTATRSVKPRQKLATPANEEYAASANSITATWDLVPNASAYRIMYKPSGGSYVTVDVDDPTATSYTISGLTKNVSYVLKIAAIGDGFDYSSSAYTALTAVTTEGGPTTLKTPTVTLASTASTVTVNWNAVPNAKSYFVLFDGTEYGAATPGYKFSFQTPKQSHTIQVRAVGDGTNYLNSAYSTAKSISTTSLDALNAPTPRVQNITASSISVSWSAINGAAGYQIAYAPASGAEGGYVVATLGAGTTSHVFTGLAPSKDFIISVRTLGDGLETTSSEYENFLFASTVDTTSALAMDEEWFQEEEWFEELDDNFDLLAENLLHA